MISSMVGPKEYSGEVMVVVTETTYITFCPQKVVKYCFAYFEQILKHIFSCAGLLKKRKFI